MCALKNFVVYFKCLIALVLIRSYGFIYILKIFAILGSGRIVLTMARIIPNCYELINTKIKNTFFFGMFINVLSH